ncbi:unnamed protein product [Spirodela intermedia]|uniref:Uncharacterized protein n=1 Tax=Spirodela intermedia TaxID=51605 RepID=A0A7I8JK37_SPIIN|nr:unnamed protein product [Spirodela intermedia]CAA6670498.1 unnamed protein product [Spirodela intermedia]
MPRKMDADSDSEAPDELTAEQAIKQDHEIRKLQIESKTRISRESKERRRKWAQRKTQRSSSAQDVEETEGLDETDDSAGMLPSNIVEHLVTREKQLFSSDTEGETIVDEPVSRKKKHKHFGVRPVILKNVRPSHCLKDSMEFLKKRRSQVPRSWATLKDSHLTLPSISSPGGLLS